MANSTWLERQKLIADRTATVQGTGPLLLTSLSGWDAVPHSARWNSEGLLRLTMTDIKIPKRKTLRSDAISQTLTDKFALRGLVSMWTDGVILNQYGNPTPQGDYIDLSTSKKYGTNYTMDRPAFHPGWQVTFRLYCWNREILTENEMLHVVSVMGDIGLGAKTPKNGQFKVIGWEPTQERSPMLNY